MEIYELSNLKNTIQKGTSENGIKKQHSLGKLTVRERISRLVDQNSFVEIGTFVEHRSTSFGMQEKKIAADGVICGSAKINGRDVYIVLQDFTAQGGTLGEMHALKIAECQERALKYGVPIIMVSDSGGARIQEGIDALAGFGKLFDNSIKASGVIPQISIIAGPSAGGAVYLPALTDFIFMVNGISDMFITGPSVIKAVTGEVVSAEDLGGASVQNKVSGVAHFYEDTEDECYSDVKKLLSFLPQNNLDDVKEVKGTDSIDRICDSLDTIIPSLNSKSYDVKDVIKEIADNGAFMEYQALFATNIVTCFVRINGAVVGIIANQPKVNAGSIDTDASDKAARFIRTLDAFNIPLVTLVDVPGFLPGIKEEHKGIIRHGAKLLYAYSEASVPKITIIMRKAYGGAYIAMCSKHLGADVVYAWPTAEIAVMGSEGAVNILYSKEIKANSNPEFREEKIEAYKNEFMTPLIAARRGYIDDIIVPSSTRKYIINALQLLKNKKIYKIQKKHGNIPL